MADSTSTPNGVRNGYLKDLKANDTIPGVYTADISIKDNVKKLLEDYEKEGDAFSEEVGIAIVTGDYIIAETVIPIGSLEKDAPGKSYKEFKALKMEQSEKNKKLHADRNGMIIDRNKNGIDDRLE